LLIRPAVDGGDFRFPIADFGLSEQLFSLSQH
jgi:hypothetical protein